ncbi:hypothetical protein GCK32_009265 [Trichostrongylus colubriformis]|uniref:ANK_REP_REGION domain-containing protein n=1 Tax=Trichostrongylus colubriformis TaxID=6319 RepID=A0AAN8FR52_TRICO
MESSERYLFGYLADLASGNEPSGSTTKRLRKRLQRQQSGQIGRCHAGESSEAPSLIGTPTDTGRSFTFEAAQRIMRERDDARPVSCQNLPEIILEAIHCDDANLIERLLVAHSVNQPISASPSIGSTNTLTELAQRRHGAGAHRRSNASSTVSMQSNSRFTCAMTNILHVAVAHKRREITELLLRSGYDPNLPAACHCKGKCTATGNAPLISVMTRTPSMTPELCSTCSQLRMVSILDQTPLGVAVRAQSSELIALLIAYGADVNLGDEDGNTPLMTAVRESPLCWPCLHTLIFFGAQIEQRNMRGICPLDLAPELRTLQRKCVNELFKIACTSDNELSTKTTSTAPTFRQWNRLHSDNASTVDRTSSKPPLSAKPSAAPSVSSCGMLVETYSTRELANRKSLAGFQNHKKAKVAKENTVFNVVGCEQAWELLKSMASNPECIDAIVGSIARIGIQEATTSYSADVLDVSDENLGALLHRVICTAIEDYESSTPSYKKQKNLHLIWLLSQIATFCNTFIQKGSTVKQFSALITLNKIIDAGLVYDLFSCDDIVFHSSRVLNRSHTFSAEEPASFYESLDSNDDQYSTVDHVFVYGLDNGYGFPMHTSRM